MYDLLFPDRPDVLELRLIMSSLGEKDKHCTNIAGCSMLQNVQNGSQTYVKEESNLSDVLHEEKVI